MGKYRNWKIDMIKGFLVLLVIWGHCLDSKSYVNRMILAFHMPLFFCVSGYLLKYTNAYERSSIELILEKANRLLVPYFFWEGVLLTISLIIRPFYGNIIHESKVLQSIITCLNTTEYNGVCLRLWFFPTLFVSNLYMLFIVRLQNYVKSKKSVYYIIALFAIHYTMGKVVFDRLPFTMDIAIMATAYMLIGYTSEAFLKKIKELNKFEAIVLEVFTLGILIISVNCSEIGLRMYCNLYGNYIWTIIGSLSGCILVVNGVYIMNKKFNILNWFSYNSLMIFPLHLAILFFLRWYINEKMLMKQEQPYYSVILFLICVIILIPLANAINKWCPIFNGRSKEK